MKVLGILWNSTDDTLKITVSKILEEIYVGSETLTKRIVTSVIAKIIDPMGFVEPFVLKGKVML